MDSGENAAVKPAVEPVPAKQTRTGRAVLITLLVFVVLAYTASRVLSPIVEKQQNKVLFDPPYKVSAEAQKLHDSLLVADMHSDTLLWNRDLLKKNTYGHVDVPRLIEGNVALQCFTVVTKSPKGLNIENNDADTFDNITALSIVQLWPPATWNSLKERALYEAGKLQSAADDSKGKLTFVKTSADLDSYLERRKNDRGITAGILGLEGCHALEGDIKNVDLFYQKGYRLFSPTHFFDNEMGGSAHGSSKAGLTPFGKQVIKRMEALKITVDLAHASPRMIDDVLDIATRPVMVSHTGVRGVVNNSRNLSDHSIVRIAKNGGIIGIGYWDTAVGKPDAKAIAKSIRYVADLAGVDHVALGSDYDGTVTTSFDTSGVAEITEALMDQGFTEDEIRLIMGGNTMKLFRENLPEN